MKLSAPPSSTGLTPDQRLLRCPARDLDAFLASSGEPGATWESRRRVFPYALPKDSPAHACLAVEWTWPGCFAWLSIQQAARPNFALLAALLDRAPAALAWAGCGMPGEQAVWAGVCLLRDRRIFAADGLMTKVLVQALSGTPSAQRESRAAQVLGAGLAPAMDTLAAWGSSGWDATRDWGKPLVGLLLAATHPDPLALSPQNPWVRWGRALALAGFDAPAMHRVQDQALAHALEGWAVLLGQEAAPEHSCFADEDIAELWRTWSSAPEHRNRPMDPAVRQALMRVAERALEYVKASETALRFNGKLRRLVAPALALSIKTLEEQGAAADLRSRLTPGIVDALVRDLQAPEKPRAWFMEKHLDDRLRPSSQMPAPARPRM